MKVIDLLLLIGIFFVMAVFCFIAGYVYDRYFTDCEKVVFEDRIIYRDKECEPTYIPQYITEPCPTVIDCPDLDPEFFKRLELCEQTIEIQKQVIEAQRQLCPQ